MLGRIFGKVTTKEFNFKIDSDSEVKNLEYIKVYHPSYDFVLAQIVELVADKEGLIAKCDIIGYNDDGVKPMRIPFEPGSEVFKAEDDFIREVISMPETGAFIGKLEGRDINISLELNKLLTKHAAVLAKSGAGKSYTVGVLIEEILESGVPLLIIDPHGEYGTLKQEAKPSKEELEKMALFSVFPKAYPIQEYGDPKLGLNPIQLNSKLSKAELVHMLPKLNSTQQGLLYSAIRDDHTDFDQLLLSLESEESMAKWSLINLVEGLKNHNIFSNAPISFQELIIPGTATIMNLKGYPPEIQELIVYKLTNDLFSLRKNNKVPPFFLVIEEAHNFCPERSYGEAASSKILRNVASEGRKFGLGLCVISQRPARVDKSVLSQCTTQIVLKVTNPNDLKAISNSLEGITSETEKEIKNLSIGTALITGLVDMPLMINVRPRRTAHGGEAVDIVKNNSNGELLPVIFPTVSKHDLIMMSDVPVDYKEILKPALRVMCKDKEGEFPLVIDLATNELVINLDDYSTKKVAKLKDLNKEERDVMRFLFKNKKMKPLDLNVSSSVIMSLLSQGYVIKKEDVLHLSSAYHFKKLRSAALHNALIYDRVSGEKRKARFSVVDVRALLQGVVDVIDAQECWLMNYVKK